MFARLTGALVVACALLTALPAGAAAQLSRGPQKVYDDYRSDAAIQPCDHTVATYRRTLREITPDIEENTPAFRPAVEAALRERGRSRSYCLEQDSPTQPGTSGGGSSGGSTGGSAPPAAQPAPAGKPPVKTAPPAAGKPVPAAPSVPKSTAPAPAPGATPAPTVVPPPPTASSAPAPLPEVVLVDHPHEGTPMGLLIALGLLALAALLLALALLARQLGWGDERLAGARHAWGEAAYRAGATWADFVDWIRLGRGPHRL